MSHDEMIELLGAYALDAVDDQERAQLEEHLHECARCRAEVREHREVAALLAHTGGDAPAGVWQQIVSALDEPPPGLQLVRAPGPDVAPSDTRRAPSPWVPRIAVALVAAAALVVAILGVEVRRQDQRIDELQTALEKPMEPAFQEAIEAPTSQLVELASEDETFVVRGAITDDGVVYLSMSGLPRLDADHTYQLWGANGDELVSIGVLGAAPTIVQFPAHQYDLFAITEEVAPGVVTSEQAPVVAGGPA